MRALLPLLSLLLLLSKAAATSPGNLILDFILPKINSGGAQPWNPAYLPDVSVSANPGSKAADRITALPGQPRGGIAAHQYSGYIAVDEKAGRYFFYYFAEARKNASGFPIIVWMNGGPGCSSVGIGAFQGHGPLLVSPGGKFVRKSSYSWIKFAHVLYVDSPVGTGFSYSDTPSDYQKLTDSGIASDNLRFLVNWLARFPEYADREFYLGGEGYAGNYVPQLAQLILNLNLSGKAPTIRLKGLLLENAVLNVNKDRSGFFDNLWSHGVISQRMFEDINNNCLKNLTSSSCDAAIAAVKRVIAPLYMFDLTANVCNLSKKKLSIDEYYECHEEEVAAYLRLPEIQRALHVNLEKAPKSWIQCNRDVAMAYTEITTSTLSILKNLLSNNVSILIYSGDADATVPAMSSRLSIKRMKLTKTVKWHGWYSSNIEVAGFSEGYSEGLSYSTLRGAGHYAAKTKGPQLQKLLELFLEGSLANATIPGLAPE